MGRPREPEPVKPVCGLLINDLELLGEVESRLHELFGAIEDRTSLEPWQHSAYYAPDMGWRLWRGWYSFTSLASPERLAEWKLATNELESQFAVSGHRRINADPGYLALLKMVLASTKDAPHRVYLRSGIFAEVTLVFERGAFRPLPHTYPDYASANALDFFSRVRQRYLAQRRARTDE
ncbi:MAG: GTP-binding protein [Candidatus Binatia bacterium]|nr:MAG: GTP-binding protein [Candidatus Binatia bacterium]